jgi:hypothetical protein
MKLKTAYNRGIYLLTRPEWDEHAHVELQNSYLPGRKVGGVKTKGRHSLQPWVMYRNEVGERRLESPEKEGWIEWKPPADVAERAKEFNWETYKHAASD